MKKYFDENGDEIIVFEKEERGEKGKKGERAPFPPAPPAPGPRGPLARFPWWSIYTPVVPCIYDSNITLLEQISKLYYYANKLNDAINQNHDDIISLGERVDDLDVALAEILELVGDLPKFVVVEFDTAAETITADHTFAEVLAEYQAGSIVIGRASAHNALYIATVGGENAIVFLTPQSAANITITMTPTAISQALTRYLTAGGGTVTGILNLLNAPVSDLNAANKGYVDRAIANAIAAIDLSNYLQITGGTMNGQIIQPLMPTENRHLANKRYVDETVETANLYSVGEEIKIGEWDEDGVVYNVYRKVVDFGELPNAGSKGVAHGIFDFTRFISARALATSSTNNLEIPMTSADGSNNIYMAVGNVRITIITVSDRSNFTTCYVELKFIRPKSPPILTIKR